VSVHPALRTCACGHVANHHLDKLGCQIAGCPCRRFDGQNVSREQHRATIEEANRRLRKAWAQRDRYRAALERIESHGAGVAVEIARDALAEKSRPEG
jgi:hypothetical protein